MYWDQLTSTDLDQFDRSVPVLISISATEQHGPHLPMATDHLIGRHFCSQLDQAIPDEVLILPTLGIGCSEHHTTFPGSLSISHQTMLNYLLDVFHWVANYGFTNLIVLNSHGGNQGIGRVFLEQFGFKHPDCQVVFLSWWQLVTEELKEIVEGGSKGNGHAGELETSLIMHIAPELVQDELIPEFSNKPTYDWAENSLISGSKASLYQRFQQISDNGTMGTPRLANPEKGKQITEFVTKAMIGLLRSLVTMK